VRTLGNFALIRAKFRESTSHTATSSNFGWVENAAKSREDCPDAPKAMWRSLPFGDAALMPAVT